jgi:hypothetical protein
VRPSKYWTKVCAPALSSRKNKLGRTFPEREIAAAVAKATGKRTSRSLVGMWLGGAREPYISQFIALCDTLGIDPKDVL